MLDLQNIPVLTHVKELNGYPSTDMYTMLKGDIYFTDLVDMHTNQFNQSYPNFKAYTGYAFGFVITVSGYAQVGLGPVFSSEYCLLLLLSI